KGEVLQRLVTTLTKLGRSNEALVYAKTLSEANPQGTMLQDKFKQGVELFQAGKLDEAEAILQEVYNESHNESVGALIGMIRYARNDLKGAAEYLSSNVDPEVASDSAMTALAATQLRLSQPEKLLEIFDARARANLKDPGLKTLVGIALLQTGQTAEGEKLVTEARTAHPENSLIQGTIARYYLLSAQTDRAIETLQAAIKAKPDASLSRLLIAAYAGAGKADQALGVAQQQAKESPAKAESWWLLGRTALQLQQLDQAEPALQNALKQDPAFQPAQLDLAQVYIRRKQPEKAAAVYKAVLQKNNDAIAALKGMTVVFAMQGANPSAIESQLLSLSKSDSARAVLGEFYLRRQQFEDADRLLKPLPQGDGTSYPDQLKQLLALTSAGRALQARDFTGARNRIVEGLKVNPRNADLLILLAR
ncbi:o-linked n-acetylglucosamine transferase, ogt, putative, partial [Ricinus communis]